MSSDLRRSSGTSGGSGSSSSSRRHGRGKGTHKRKKNQHSSMSLTQDDIDFLKKNTRYDEQEIREWYKGFKADCPDGLLDKDKIQAMYGMILPAGNAKVFVDQIFRIFDKDGNGSIDFKEFMMATDMTASGSPEEKLRWAFKMYDKDGSGTIDLAEMIEIIGTLYEMEGVSKESASERAHKIFGELDINGDGELTTEEFVKGCLEDPELVRLLNAGGIESDNEDNIPNNLQPTAQEEEVSGDPAVEIVAK